ncbi:MAG TPA: helix-turn-helix domain-containing protein [Dehalococcoidia bacterium]|nr:helix-turn-helix domain-containing protein [Dehalococcoidia bacterium]
MKPNGRNLNLTSCDEIFQTEETRIESSQEKVIDIPLTELHPFKNHPFKVTDDESMLETAESIDAIREAVRELEQAGYIIRTRERNEFGHLKGTDYMIFEKPHLSADSSEIKEPMLEKPALGKPTLENSILDNPVLEKPTLENPTQLNTKKTSKDPLMTMGLSKHPSIPDPSREDKVEKDEMRLDAHSIKEAIKDKIEYKFIVQRYDKDRLNEIVDLMVETLCSKREYITVAGDDYPASLVKERLQRIDSTHIEYVFECLDKNTTFIRNIKKYLLKTLFNAPSTIDSYYTALVKHDLYGPGTRFYEDLGSLIKSNK